MQLAGTNPEYLVPYDEPTDVPDGAAMSRRMAEAVSAHLAKLAAKIKTPSTIDTASIIANNIQLRQTTLSLDAAGNVLDTDVINVKKLKDWLRLYQVGYLQGSNAVFVLSVRSPDVREQAVAYQAEVTLDPSFVPSSTTVSVHSETVELVIGPNYPRFWDPERRGIHVSTGEWKLIRGVWTAAVLVYFPAHSASMSNPYFNRLVEWRPNTLYTVRILVTRGGTDATGSYYMFPVHSFLSVD
jgi:hypothetical protein